MTAMPNGCDKIDTVHGGPPHVGEFTHPLLPRKGGGSGPGNKQHGSAFNSLFKPSRSAEDEGGTTEYLALFVEFLRASRHASEDALLALGAVIDSKSAAGIVHTADFRECVSTCLC
jgi:hypothetical protein